MRFKIRDLLDSIDEQDLYKMQNDLTKGGIFLKKLIDSRIKELESVKSGFCVTCGEDLSKKPTSYTLIFGPDDFRKKATFCEIDCLEYFLSGIKKTERNIGRNEGENNAI